MSSRNENKKVHTIKESLMELDGLNQDEKEEFIKFLENDYNNEEEEKIL